MKDELLDLVGAIIYASICAVIIGLFVLVGYAIFLIIDISSLAWKWTLLIIAFFLTGILIFKLWIRIDNEYIEKRYGIK